MVEYRNAKSICLSLLFTFWFAAVSADESIVVDISVSNWVEGSEIWVGVLTGDQESTTVEWKMENTNEFMVEIISSDTLSLPKLLFLKKNTVPVVKQLTTELISTGIAIEFETGLSITGRVSEKKNGTPVTEGMVSVVFEEEFQFPLPEPSWFSWPVKSEGTYELRGLPNSKITVTAFSPGFMPAKEEIIMRTEVPNPFELNFRLSNAFYINGSIRSSNGESIQGVIDAAVSPEQSQTTPFHTDFDDNNLFRIGPFTEDASIELTARISDGRRSRPLEGLTVFSAEILHFS